MSRKWCAGSLWRLQIRASLPHTAISRKFNTKFHTSAASVSPEIHQIHSRACSLPSTNPPTTWVVMSLSFLKMILSQCPSVSLGTARSHTWRPWEISATVSLRQRLLQPSSFPLQKPQANVPTLACSFHPPQIIGVLHLLVKFWFTNILLHIQSREDYFRSLQRRSPPSRTLCKCLLGRQKSCTQAVS